MEYTKIVVGALDSNVYLFYSKKNKEAVCFDAGGGLEDVLEILNSEGLSLKYLVLTHGHFDHIEIAVELRKRTGCKIIVHEQDAELLKEPRYNFSANYPNSPDVSFEADILVKDGEILDVMGEKLEFIHTPGHTKGSMCIRFGSYLVTGDTLFKGSIGRTDLYGGSMKSMYSSLQIFGKMDKRLVVLPGHGPSTTVEDELKNNYYLRRAKD